MLSYSNVRQEVLAIWLITSKDNLLINAKRSRSNPMALLFQTPSSFLDLQFDVDPAIPHPDGDAIDQQWIVDLIAEMADDEMGVEVLDDPSFRYYVNQLKEAVAANRWYVLLRSVVHTRT